MYTPYEVRRGTSPSIKGKLTISKSKSSRKTRNYGGTIGDLDLLLLLRGVGFSNSISLLSLKHPKRLWFLMLSLEPLRCLPDIICFWNIFLFLLFFFFFFFFFKSFFIISKVAFFSTFPVLLVSVGCCDVWLVLLFFLSSDVFLGFIFSRGLRPGIGSVWVTASSTVTFLQVTV